MNSGSINNSTPNNKPKRSKFNIMLVVLAILCVMSAITSLRSGALQVNAAVVTAALFFIAYLMRKQIIEEKRKGLRYVITGLAFVMFIICFGRQDGIGAIGSETEGGTAVRASCKDARLAAWGKPEPDLTEAQDKDQTEAEREEGQVADSIMPSSERQTANSVAKAAAETEVPETSAFTADDGQNLTEAPETAIIPAVAAVPNTKQTLQITSKSTEKTTTTARPTTAKRTEKSTTAAEAVQSSQNVYITPYGKKYHYDKACAGKNATSVSKSEAQKKYTACKKCA